MNFLKLIIKVSHKREIGLQLFLMILNFSYETILRPLQNL